MLCFSVLQNSHSLLDLPQVHRRNGNKAQQSHTRERMLALTRGTCPRPLWHYKHLITSVVNSPTRLPKSGVSKKQRTDIHMTVKNTNAVDFVWPWVVKATDRHQLTRFASVYFPKAHSLSTWHLWTVLTPPKNKQSWSSCPRRLPPRPQPPHGVDEACLWSEAEHPPKTHDSHA